MEESEVINCLSVQCGSADDLYIPFIIIGVSIKHDDYVISLINNLLKPILQKMCVYEHRRLHVLYPHYLIIINEIITRNLLVTSCVDLVFDDEVSMYANMWEVTFKRFKRMKRTLYKEGTNYYYFSVKNEHIVENSYSFKQVINGDSHPYLIFVYFWSLLLRLEKLKLDCFLTGVPRFTVNEVSKLGLIPRCILKERTKVVLINAYLKNKLKQCPLWMANNYSLDKH
jgi:hypothetical protein